jgi:hypothetical protein
MFSIPHHKSSRPTPSRDQAVGGLILSKAFIDFAPLIAWRKRENARLPEPMTISAALLWGLATHPSFAGLHMGTTVEVAATGSLERGVGVVVVRPSDYFEDADGLAQYVRAFNRQTDLTRRRASSGCRTLDAAALIPPSIAAALLRYALEQGTVAFGSVGLTILKDAKVFGAPIGDAGHDNGFLAVGSMTLPTSGGGMVGCVTIKGPAATVAKYPAALQEVLNSQPSGLVR